MHRTVASVLEQELSLSDAGDRYEDIFAEENSNYGDATHNDLLEMEDMFLLGLKLLEHYVPWLNENLRKQYKLVAVEQPFEIDFPDFTLAGRVDSLWKDKWGRIWVCDLKTAKSFPNVTTLSLDVQMMIYTWAIQQVFKLQVAGALMNVIRKQNPDTARTPVIQLYEIPRTPGELKALDETVVQLLNAVKETRENNIYLPRPGMKCAWGCDYQDLCIKDLHGHDTDYMKETQFHVREKPNYLEED